MKLIYPVLFFIVLCSTSVLADLDPGILPDSPFYFIDTMFERPSDDPEKALGYREEKIAEARAMAEKKKAEYAQRALDKASEYGSIIEEQATPNMEAELKESSVSLTEALDDISKDLPELGEEINKQKDQGQRTLLAAQVSSKIKQLCETLSELDPKEYAKVCQNDDAPEWQKKLDTKLTDEQKAHAKVFAQKMQQCMLSPKECDCEGMGIQSFASICKEQSTLASQCADGDQAACQSMGKNLNIQDYPPDYLLAELPEFERGERKEGQNSNSFPPPCTEAGITSMPECLKLLGREDEDFEVYQFMQQCESEASRADCMMKAREKFADRFGQKTDFEAESEYGGEIERGFEDEDFKAKMDEKYESRGMPARIKEFGRDCHAVKDLSEKVRCFEDYYDSARGEFNDDFDHKYESTEDNEKYPEERRGQPDYNEGRRNMEREYAERWSSATEEQRERMKQEYESRMGEERARYEYKDGETRTEYRDDGTRSEYRESDGYREESKDQESSDTSR